MINYEKRKGSNTMANKIEKSHESSHTKGNASSSKNR